MQVVINYSGTFSISSEAVEFIRKKIKNKEDKKSVGPFSFIMIEAIIY